MTTHQLEPVLLGALATASAIAGLFFLRFWRSSRDRLFLFFSLAFWLLGANWLARACIVWDARDQHEIYVLRLIAFALIIAGVIDKNRRASAAARPPDGDD